VPETTDLQLALTVEQCWQPVPGGSGSYIVELSRELAQRAGIAATGIAARHSGPPPDDWSVAIPVRHSRLPRRALYDAWQRLGGPRAEAFTPDAEVVHATTWAIPSTRRPLVVTVHDVAFLHDASHFTARGNAFFRRALEQTRAATSIIVPSQATADDCLAVGLRADRITVVPHASRAAMRTPGDVIELRARLGLDRPYVMWCGTIEPRKNLARLLAGFAEAAPQLPDVDLVLVGPPGWGSLPRMPHELASDRVHVLGNVSRHDLDTVYAGASVFCFPSLREGFGLPVLEAMQHGVPVVTSRATACAEVAGDAALLVDPYDPHEIADGLVAAFGAHDDLATASRRRAAQFTWSATTSTTISVYREARAR